jgi:YD repeat-containing protein
MKLLAASILIIALTGPAAAQQFQDSLDNVSVRQGDTIHSYDSQGRLLGTGTRRGNVWAFRYTNGSRHTYASTRSGNVTTTRGERGRYFGRTVDHGDGTATVYQRGKPPATARRVHD